MLYSYAEKVGPGKKIYGKLPVEHAVYLLNEKRKVLMDLEDRYGVMVEIIPDFTQSLLAPNPFTEEGGKPLENKPERRERRTERRERRTERSERSDRRPTKGKDRGNHRKSRKIVKNR